MENRAFTLCILQVQLFRGSKYLWESKSSSLRFVHLSRGRLLSAVSEKRTRHSYLSHVSAHIIFNNKAKLIIDPLQKESVETITSRLGKSCRVIFYI